MELVKVASQNTEDVKKAERKEKTMWNEELTNLFLTHRLALRKEFMGKSIPKYGIQKVYERMYEENPALVTSRNLNTDSVISKWKQLMSSTRKFTDECNKSGGANCELKKPMYYDIVMECLGSEGRVAVHGGAFVRDSSAGTKRVGYWDAGNLLDSQYPEHVPSSPHTDKEGDEDNEVHDTEEEDLKETVKDESVFGSPKRMSKRERISARSQENSTKLFSSLKVTISEFQVKAEERFERLQTVLKEETSAKMAHSHNLQQKEHEKRDREMELFMAFCTSLVKPANLP